MNQRSFNRLVTGYQRFLVHYTRDDNLTYREKAGRGQSPKIMMITCCDSRISPEIITDSELGEIFTVANVANLVPPYKEGRNSHHSTSAALEFAINTLRVEQVIVMGHSGCGGIRALIEGADTQPKQSGYSFIQPWMSIATKAKEKVVREHSDCSVEHQAARCERESLLVSLDNLKSFPWIATALSKGELGIHAWHFDIETGIIEAYNQKKERFIPLIG